MDFEYDVIVIGAGVAGALCAWKLSQQKKLKILIIDAGKNELDEKQRKEFVKNYALAPVKNSLSPYAVLESNTFAPSPDGGNRPESPTHYYVQKPGGELFKSNYVRINGGSTWVWRGNTPRFIPSDFQLKTQYGVGDDWPITYDDLEPYYCGAERELGVAGNDLEWSSPDGQGLLGAWRSQRFPMPNIIPSYGDQIVKQAIEDIVVDGKRIEVVTTPQARNSQPYDGRKACQGNSNCIPICPSGAKYDAGVHLIKALNNGVELKRSCVVTRLQAGSNGEVHTVFFKDWSTTDKKEQSLTGNVVVLALNAIETPKLWLLSKLGNKSDQVGRNLMDHLAEEVAGLFPEPLYPFRGPQSTISIEVFRDGDFRKHCGAFRMTIGNDGWGRKKHPTALLDDLIWDRKNQKLLLFGTGLQSALEYQATRLLRIGYSTEMLPHRDNRVTLADEKDSLGILRPKITFELEDYSKKALAYGQSVARRIWSHLEQTKGATGVQPLEPSFEYNGAGHIMGTCRMGKDAANSVVDENCRSHEHKNLYVVGSSVFVTGATANPTLTVAALTLRTAEAIQREL